MRATDTAELPMTFDMREVARLATDVGLGQASIAVRCIGHPFDGSAIELDGARTIYPASMIKTPIALVAARQVHAGLRRPEDDVVIASTQMTANDAASPLVPGYRTTLWDLVKLMLARSDNVATNALIDLITRETLTAGCRELGLEHTAVRCKLSGSLPLLEDPARTGRNNHPAGDAAQAFELIATDRHAAFGWVYDALRAQIWNGKLSTGWDTSDVFAHKTGDTDNESHDGGILTLPDGRRFVVVVYTQARSTPSTDAAFGAFARGLRRFLATL